MMHKHVQNNISTVLMFCKFLFTFHAESDINEKKEGYFGIDYEWP